MGASYLKRHFFRAALCGFLIGGALACGDPDSRPARWEYIQQAIVAQNCATSGCHSQLVQNAGLDFSNPTLSREQLLSRQYVLPGNPNSPLMFLLQGRERRRMPPDAPLPNADIDLIERWIVEGAVE
jgi:hypothetical protein